MKFEEAVIITINAPSSHLLTKQSRCEYKWTIHDDFITCQRLDSNEKTKEWSKTKSKHLNELFLVSQVAYSNAHTISSCSESSLCTTDYTHMHCDAVHSTASVFRFRYTCVFSLVINKWEEHFSLNIHTNSCRDAFVCFKLPIWDGKRMPMCVWCVYESVKPKLMCSRMRNIQHHSFT